MSKLDFASYLHPKFVEVVKELSFQGAEILVVGGTVRDFFLGVPNKHDYDCEVRFPKLDDDKRLEQSFALLEFPTEKQVEELPYKIKKIDFKDFSCEFSLPRLETYRAGEFHHKNFEADFVNDMDYKIGFKRRDFTLNAMGMVYREGWELVDPLGGKKDLKKKLLKPCSKDFYQDPVRFLRAIRFQNLYGFKMEKELKESFKALDKEKLPPHYIIKEAHKSAHPLDFFFDLYEEHIDQEQDSRLDHFMDLHTPLMNYKDHLDKLNYLPLWFVNRLAKIHGKKELSESIKQFPNLKRLKTLNYLALNEEEKKEILWFARFLTWPTEYQVHCLIFFNSDLSKEKILQMQDFKVETKAIDSKLRTVYKTLEQIKMVL